MELTTRRINGLENIAAQPTTIFTLRHGNPQSEKVIQRLGEYEQNKNTLCSVFSDPAIAEPKLVNSAQAFINAVVLFDCEAIGGCFSPFCQILRPHQPKFPEWARRTLWGVAVNKKLPEARIENVAKQVQRAFLTERFLDWLDAGRLPWGNPQSLASRQRRKREQRYRARVDSYTRAW